jgi:hypothetical protein
MKRRKAVVEVAIRYRITPTAEEFVRHPATIKKILDHIAGQAMSAPGFTVGKTMVVRFRAGGKDLAVALDNTQGGWHAVICTPDEERAFFRPNKPAQDGNHRTWTN